MDENSTSICTVPWNFSWVKLNRLAAMGWPKTIENIEFLINESIKHLVTLSPEMIPPIDDRVPIKWHLIPIEEFEAPCLDDIVKFIGICEKAHKNSEAVGVHCRMGRGRTGVMVACYLVHFDDLIPAQAITKVRLQRPGSVETQQQERIIFLYYDYLRRTKE